MNDLSIARQATPMPIADIAARLGVPESALFPIGPHMAKVDTGALAASNGKTGRLVLVTAINPTPTGEGKTTVSVGLADGLSLLGKKTALALREPSLGPVFGVKGGAAGGGYAQVVPMEDINLHFTGDLHAITAANNLLAAMIDNHIFQGNALGIDARAVSWRRCMDMNDRQLRSIVGGLGGKSGGAPREDGFDITAASEVMAVFCLASSLDDLRLRLSRIVVAATYEGNPVTAGDLGADGAMTLLLKRAFQPNLVQTLEGTPAFIHGGPFANIAHGCNSVAATRAALSLADYTVTEAGFGADLGAEKFIDIKCRAAGLAPSAVVVVATVRALKMHGGVKKEELAREDAEAVTRGSSNLMRHLENLSQVFGVKPVVAINRFVSDSDAEIAAIADACRPLATAVLCEAWAKGGAGARALAQAVVKACDETTSPADSLRHAYPLDAAYAAKIRAIAKRVYGAADIAFAPGVLTALKKYDTTHPGMPVCMAKTQYSLSDDPKKLGRPEDFTLTVRQARLSAGAGFIVAFAGEIIAMPGLPKQPAACSMGIDGNGETFGLF